MSKTLALIFALFSMAGSCLAQALEFPTRTIDPKDIVQDSIRLLRFSTNKFTVRWTYTEEGAMKMLAFREACEGKTTRVVVGDYESQLSPSSFRPMPPTFTNYAQWKEGWLKHRGDNFFSVTEENAKKIIAGLKSR